MILSTKQKKIMGMESRLVFAEERRERTGWMGNLRLVDAKYYISNSWIRGLYCTTQRNCEQSFGLEHDGRQYYKKECVCVCMCRTWSHGCTAEIERTLHINYN